MFNKIYTSKNPAETFYLAGKIKNYYFKGGIIILKGDLGSGKTVFVQGVAHFLGINKRIVSPTFVLTKVYQINMFQKLYHLDCYRLSEGDSPESLGLSDIFSNPFDIVCIEWPEKIKKNLPQPIIELHFSILPKDFRKIKVIINY